MSLRTYQREAARWLTERRAAALFADQGVGKTYMLLTVLRRLQMLRNDLSILIVAPLRVIYNVWPAEIYKWNFGFTYSVLHGKDKNKALAEHTDIHLINPEGLRWLEKSSDSERYNVLIIDESSMFRNHSTARFKVLKKMLSQFDRVYILTGTPTPRCLHDLWTQIYLLDQGAALGRNITTFRARYFNHSCFRNRHKYTLQRGADKEINSAISQLCYRLDAASNIELPDLLFNDIEISMPADALKIYRDMERRLFAEIDEHNVFASTSGVAYNMCRQIAGGALYDEDDKTQYTEIHDAKIKALQELISELYSKPLLVVYHYRHELERIIKAIRKVEVLNGTTSTKETTRLLEKWNGGKIAVLVAHAQSISHGLNMQNGGNDICWYTVSDNYDVYEQLNRRIYRSGVTGTVRIHRLIARDTVDAAVIERLSQKCSRQDALFAALQRYREARCIKS
jgi:SNF2 family DNA or RNA helicase